MHCLRFPIDMRDGNLSPPLNPLLIHRYGLTGISLGRFYLLPLIPFEVVNCCRPVACGLDWKWGWSTESVDNLLPTHIYISTPMSSQKAIQIIIGPGDRENPEA